MWSLDPTAPHASPLGNVSIVAGANRTSWGSSTPSAVVKALMPGACDPDQAGSTFVFGGPTRLSVASGNYDIFSAARSVSAGRS